MAKAVNLLGYWMPLLRKIKEFQEIAKAETPELEYILAEIDRTLNNMFIETADEYGVSRFEAMLGITPEEESSLETRRFNILTKWNDQIPYTDQALYERLVSLCGSADLFTIEEHYTDYLISITTSLGVAGAFDTVLSVLQEMLPCNLVLELANILQDELSNTLSVGVATCTGRAYLITNDINEEYDLEHNLYIASGQSQAQTHLITHDIEVEDSLEESLYNAVGVGYATTTLITHDAAFEAESNGNTTVANAVSSGTVITINE